jgi:hypothetical protein
MINCLRGFESMLGSTIFDLFGRLNVIVVRRVQRR